MLLVILSLSISSVMATDVKVVYVEPGFSSLHVETYRTGGDPVEFIFSKLHDPPHGYMSFVPPDVLRVYFEVGNTLVLDLKRSPLEGLGFLGERFFLYQVLASIFLSFDCENVKIIIDGEEAKVLVSEVDLRFSFTRGAWMDWITEMIGR